jgi:hypothetical protein
MNDWIKCAFNVKNSCSLYEMHSSIAQNLMVTDNCFFFLFLVFQEMVFCYQNWSDLLWEKIVLVIEKNSWNSRLKAENLQNFWDHSNNLFKQWKVRTIFGNRMFLFFLFLEVSHVGKNRTIIIQNGKNYWDLETCSKS